MNDSVKGHLPIIVVVTLVGIATGYLALGAVRGAAAGMSLSAFSAWIILVPCAIIFACSFVIAATAPSIGNHLFIVAICISIVTGGISMVVTSGWMADPELAAALVANSPEGAVVVPVLQAPLTMLRDFAAFIVAPTIGLIAGAWVGSRLHPMQKADDAKSAKKKRRKR